MIGETLGNYRVVSLLGTGGMGEVFLAEHKLIGRKAAIKVLLPQMSLDQDLVQRFFNEARMAGRLQHPGLVEVFDYGVHQGSAYIVMELLVGESLTQAIAKSGGGLDVVTMLAIARQVAVALDAAHEHGIVHRDLKPENLFLIEDPEAPAGIRAKVLDFGIAKLAPEEAPRSVKTKTGAVFGTPRYMAPEQCKSAAAVDRRADIYGLGCIMFEMLVGRAPFDYDSWGELVAAHIHEVPPNPTSIDSTLPAELDPLVLRALAKQAGDRYQTMAELVEAIDIAWEALAYTGLVDEARPRDLARGTRPRGRAASKPAIDTAKTAPSAPTLPVAAEMTPSVPPAPRRRRSWLPIGGVIAAAAIAGAAYVILPGAISDDDAGEKPRPAPPPAASPAPAPTPAPTPAPAAAAPPAIASPAEVTLQVESEPSGADIYRRADGVRIGRTPFTTQIERIDGEIDLLLKMSGYRDRAISLSTARDGRTVVKLVAQARRSGGRPDRRGDKGRDTDRPKPERAGSGDKPTFIDVYGDEP